MYAYTVFRKITIAIVIVLIVLCAGARIHAQEPPEPRSALKMKFDLVFDTGVKLLQTMQDNDGFLWSGGLGGLGRWDGYTFKHYKTGPGELSNGNIYGIVSDSQNPDILWIATQGGLNRLDKTTDTFTYYKHDPDDPESISNSAVQHLAQDTHNPDVLWVATVEGFNRFDKSTGKFTRYLHNPNDPGSLAYNRLWRVLDDADDPDILWIIPFREGFERFNKKTGTFTHYRHDPDDPTSLGAKNNITSAVVQDRDDPNILWIGTTHYGLEKFDKKTGTFIRHYPPDPEDSESVRGGPVLYLYDDGYGRLWIGGMVAANGLTVFEKKTESFTSYKNASGDPYSLVSDFVSHVFEDRSGILWVSSFNGKVSKIDRYTQNFEIYRNNPDTPRSLNSNVVTGIYEDSGGFIWLSTQGGGLNKFDRKTGIFTSYQNETDDPASLHAGSVMGMFEDSSGIFWVSSLLGPLQIFDRKAGKVAKRYENKVESFAIITETPGNPDILWMGTRMGGLARLEKSTETFTFYMPDPENPEKGPNNEFVNSIFHDSDGKTIWLGTWHGGGLSRLDKTTATFTHYTNNPDDPKSLSANSVAAIHRDRVGRLWIGVEGGGLNKFDEQHETFIRYTKDQGIPSDVESILEDKKGFLWLGTNEGIIEFNPQTGTVERKYNQSDGLQGDKFSVGCALKTRDGQMWFGGTNGVNSFYPERLLSNPYIPPVVLTSLTQWGAQVDWGNNKVPARLDEIRLDWQHNFFEFEFTALNYTLSVKNQYAYMLEGIDKDWYHSGTHRRGRYTALPGGNYTLRLKASNNDGIWNEAGVGLKITVTPPFWKTWWFYSIITACGAALAGFLYAQQIGRLKAKNEARLLNKEMELARQIQTAILPKDIQHDELEIESIMFTADQVGGDFYDILYSEEGTLWIAIGDVSGHGVTPGLIMMMAQTVHTTIATHYTHSPREVVCALNNVLCRNVQERLGKDHFMTFTTLKYHGNGRFEHAGAHLSMVLYRQKTHTCELIRTPGTFLNMIKDISASTVNSFFTLETGDILVLYSDGLTEAQNRAGELLDILRFQEIIANNAEKSTLEMRDAVIQDVLRWCEHKWTDDMSLIVVRRVR